MVEYGHFIVWMLGLSIIVGIVIYLLAVFVQRDSLRYDREFVWIHPKYEPNDPKAD